VQVGVVVGLAVLGDVGRENRTSQAWVESNREATPWIGGIVSTEVEREAERNGIAS